MTTSPTPAEASSTSAGPAKDSLRALADEWNTTAAEMQAAYEVWKAQGRHDVAWIAEGRARQLNDCADALRAALEES